MEWRRELQRLVYGFSLGMLLTALVLLVGSRILGSLVWTRLGLANEEFTAAAGREPVSILPEILAGYQAAQTGPLTASRWLILGKDEVAGSGRVAVLTDTMLVATYQPADGVMKLLSLPRDWYHPVYATKINALYTYGQQYDPQQPTLLLKTALAEMLGLSFDHIVTLSLEDVRQLIDILGGVEVAVQRGFTDALFPRAGVDVTKVNDPALLYETVSFTAGSQVMSGETALKFMRSRYSTDPQEGNDEARVARQQLVIKALAADLMQPRVIGNPTILGNLYRWYADRWQTEVSLFDLGYLAGEIAVSHRSPELTKVDLPLTNAPVATNAAALLIHPPVAKYGQWVYEAADPSFAAIRQFIQSNGF